MFISVKFSQHKYSKVIRCRMEGGGLEVADKCCSTAVQTAITDKFPYMD